MARTPNAKLTGRGLEDLNEQKTKCPRYGYTAWERMATHCRVCATAERRVFERQHMAREPKRSTNDTDKWRKHAARINGMGNDV